MRFQVLFRHQRSALQVCQQYNDVTLAFKKIIIDAHVCNVILCVKMINYFPSDQFLQHLAWC